MKIVKEEVRNFDVSSMVGFISSNDQRYALQGAGKTAYNLFCYLSMQEDGLKVGEIGSRWGSSSAMFSINPKTTVDAYDIDANCVNHARGLPDRENVTYHLEDLLVDDKIERCLEFDIIFLDITPHHGPPEEKLYRYLLDNDWKGLLICDDIGPEWPELQKWWATIETPKYDLTDIGHHAGTGLIDFSGELEVL